MPYGNQYNQLVTNPGGYIAPQTGGYVTTTPNVRPNMQNVQNQSYAGNSLGFIEVSGIDGVNRYPVAPGATVHLKDVTSDLLFVKSSDMTGTPLPLRVFRMTEITEEYQQNEGPVTRKEFNALLASIEKLSSTLDFLTSPTTRNGE